jgi:PKD repeat protein
MRSIRLLAAISLIAFGAWSCGDDGGVGPGSNPAASFTAPASCIVGAACTFTDTSTDPDGNTTITTRHWNYGDGFEEDVTGTTASRIYTTANAAGYTVTLTVTDNSGKSNSASHTVPVTATANTPPVANFTFVQTGNTVVFNSSTSTDADGTIASYEWNFGDATTSTEANPTHAYAAVTQPTPYNVTLKVTDDDGLATTSAAQTITINPATAQLCTALDERRVDCGLAMTGAASNVTFTVLSAECEIGGNKLEVVLNPPPHRTVFFNGCSVPDNTQFTPSPPIPFAAGSQMQVRFTQGTGLDAGDPTPQPPQVTLEGSYPEWTLRIDDGGAPALPRNDDIVVTVTATP